MLVVQTPPLRFAAGQNWQASPTPSPSESSWSLFGSEGQLSMALGTPSPSMSLGFERATQESVGSSGQGSQASPLPSPSASAWTPLSSGRMGLKTPLQLSTSSGTPSPSRSVMFG